MAAQAAGRERAAIVTRQQMGTTAAAAEPQVSRASSLGNGPDWGLPALEAEPSARCSSVAWRHLSLLCWWQALSRRYSSLLPSSCCAEPILQHE